MDAAYFGDFDLERICLDKIFFLVYDKTYSQGEHKFDTELRDRFRENVKRSRVKKGRFEQVIRRENRYSSWELRLGGSRVMYFHVNVIHFLQDMHDIKPSHVIYDDNFLPIDCKLEAREHIGALRIFIQDAKQIYKKLAKQYWDVDLKDIEYKIVQAEIPFEVYPASVEDISKRLYADGVAFRKYNTQSGTIYLDSNNFDNEMVTDRKYDRVSKVDDRDLKPDIVYLNKVNSGRNKNKLQIKIYQKTFGLVRIEFTIYSEDAKTLFNFRLGDPMIEMDLVAFCHHNLGQYRIKVDRYDRSLDDVVRCLAKATKEKEEIIYQLKDIEIFETCEANRTDRQRLQRKGLILKKYDNDNIAQRGVWIVNPVIQDFLRLYKPKGNEHFVKSTLFPEL